VLGSASSWLRRSSSSAVPWEGNLACVRPSNEALEQTRSATVTAAAALAAQRRCSAGTSEARRHATRTILARSILAVALLGVACGPSDARVERDFLDTHPEYAVLEVYSGEGDGDTVYKHIRYRAVPHGPTCELEVGYMKQGSDWKRFTVGEARLVGGRGLERAPGDCAGTDGGSSASRQ